MEKGIQQGKICSTQPSCAEHICSKDNFDAGTCPFHILLQRKFVVEIKDLWMLQKIVQHTRTT